MAAGTDQKQTCMLVELNYLFLPIIVIITRVNVAISCVSAGSVAGEENSDSSSAFSMSSPGTKPRQGGISSSVAMVTSTVAANQPAVNSAEVLYASLKRNQLGSGLRGVPALEKSQVFIPSLGWNAQQ